MANTTTKMRAIFGDYTLGLAGDGFHYIFNYTRGGLESLNKGGKEWLYRESLPTFWRALTDNDRGNHFGHKSSMWLGANTYMTVGTCRVLVNGAAIELPIAPANNQYSNQEWIDTLEIIFTIETTTTPKTTVEVAYLVQANGDIRVTQHFHGQKGLPELPLLGMRFIMPTVAKYFEYEGLSGETYPDRLAGGIPGKYKIAGLPVTPYLVPQDYGMHMQTKWLVITRDQTLNNSDQCRKEFSLRFEAIDGDFAFSALPYKAEELENATHIEELPVARRTVLMMLGQVRGVGGIDSWGADVEPSAHVSAEQDHVFSFIIK